MNSPFCFCFLFCFCLSYRSLLWRAAMLPLLGAGQVVGLAASGLPVLAFLLKFVEWWRSDEGNATRQAARSTVRLPIPPPPTTGVRTATSCLVLSSILGIVVHSRAFYVFFRAYRFHRNPSIILPPPPFPHKYSTSSRQEFLHLPRMLGQSHQEGNREEC